MNPLAYVLDSKLCSGLNLAFRNSVVNFILLRRLLHWLVGCVLIGAAVVVETVEVHQIHDHHQFLLVYIGFQVELDSEMANIVDFDLFFAEFYEEGLGEELGLRIDDGCWSENMSFIVFVALLLLIVLVLGVDGLLLHLVRLVGFSEDVGVCEGFGLFQK